MSKSTTTTTRKPAAVKVTPAQRARIATARAAVKDAVTAQRAAAAAVRDARSTANRAAHAARPVPVSAAAVAHVTGKPLADGGTVTVTVAPDATMGKYVSLRALAGKRVTFTREGDRYAASVTVKQNGDAARMLARAVKVEAAAAAAVKRARARVATLTGKPAVATDAPAVTA